MTFGSTEKKFFFTTLPCQLGMIFFIVYMRNIQSDLRDRKGALFKKKKKDKKAQDRAYLKRGDVK